MVVLATQQRLGRSASLSQAKGPKLAAPVQRFNVQRRRQHRVVAYAVGVPSTTLERPSQAQLPLPTKTESVVDDPSLMNPLLRQERLGTGWFGVVCEYDGVLVESTQDAHMQVSQHHHHRCLLLPHAVVSGCMQLQGSP